MTPELVREPKSRLNREEWLIRALDILAEKHNASIKIDELVTRMGVTKGSFYWHFKDREDFQQQLLEYWDHEFNKKVVEDINSAVGEQDAKARLRYLLEYLVKHDCARYDMVVRSWAAQDQKVGTVLKKVDKFRFATLHSLLTEIGIPDKEANIRSRIFVTFISLRAGLFIKMSKQDELASIDAQIEFFTRP